MNTETFDWLTAMKLFSLGVDIEINSLNGWHQIGNRKGSVSFYSDNEYRRKTTPTKTVKVAQALVRYNYDMSWFATSNYFESEQQVRSRFSGARDIIFPHGTWIEVPE